MSGTGQGSWDESWHAALEDLELDVGAAEDLLRRLHAGHVPDDAAPPPDWCPPQLSGPLPPELAERARALHRRQQLVADQLGDALVAARTQSSALRKFDRAEARPVFVDTAL